MKAKFYFPSVDTYDSHESILYCKPHFKALFTPKAVEDNEPGESRFYISMFCVN